MKVNIAPVAACQIVACLVGIGACAFPSTILDRGFWGVTTSSSSQDPGIQITNIEPGSPAAVAGLKEGDQVLAINGQKVGYYELADAWGRLPVGSEVEVSVVRDIEFRGLRDPMFARSRDKEIEEKTAVLRTVRGPDAVAARLYWGWQAMGGVVFLVIAAVVLASEPLTRLAPWRGPCVALAGFGLAVALVVVPQHAWAFQMLEQRISLGRGTDYNHYSWQLVTAITVGVLLVFLGSLDLRQVVRGIANRPQHQTGEAEPAAAPDPARDIGSGSS